MIKRFLILILFFPINVLAMNNKDIKFKVNFSNIENFSKEIEVLYYSDSKQDDPEFLSFTLNKDNQYELNLKRGVDFTSFNFDSVVVNDNSNIYDINVEKNENDELIDYLFTVKLIKKVTTTSSTTTTTAQVKTTSSVQSGNASELIIGDITTTTKTVTTTENSVTDQEKEENINRRNSIYKMVFFSLASIILIGAIFIIIKFTQSNK